MSKVKLHWNPFCERWVMRDMLGAFMEEFRDCQNFKMDYPNLDKKMVNVMDRAVGRVVAVYEKEKDDLKEEI